TQLHRRLPRPGAREQARPDHRRDGQAVVHRHAVRGYRRVPPAARWQRLHARIPDRARLRGRPRAAHLRRHERDHEGGDQPQSVSRGGGRGSYTAPMRKPNQARPLADEELARIDALLEAIDPDAAMVLEELDGFLTALACSPRPLPDEAALALACGAEAGPQPDAGAEGVAGPEREELAGLLRRHRLSIVAALHAGEGLEPVMERDDNGESAGNLWAIGFLRGIDAQSGEWSGLDDDADLADWLEPFELLAEERDLASDEVVAPIEGDRQAVVED